MRNACCFKKKLYICSVINHWLAGITTCHLFAAGIFVSLPQS
ncbi:hypothetical protein HMPREF1555_02324 [Porphyromonas gingivalis F0570]|uniref:Uncharacterized protein n=1 Tax=Porphyromonas gingivalis F0570 TaxID=1227271 RepID=A0A0E2LMZ2_PORGN|nr:hypothetical protein HMPREF1555_02324 [Porphyromonas gingivalis F0570]